MVNARVHLKLQYTHRISFELNNRLLSQWRESALKCDFLIRELKRLGIEKNDNYACIIDMHQDIMIPQHSEREKEAAGIPSIWTNIT